MFQLIHSPFFSFRTRILSLLWKSPPALFFMVQMGLRIKHSIPHPRLTKLIILLERQTGCDFRLGSPEAGPLVLLFLDGAWQVHFALAFVNFSESCSHFYLNQPWFVMFITKDPKQTEERKEAVMETGQTQRTCRNGDK